MKKVILTALCCVFLAALAPSGARAESITGEITQVGDGFIRLKEDRTRAEYQLVSNPAVIAGLRLGFRVSANASNGRISSVTVLGMPMISQAEPFQTFRVVSYPEE
ncbi:MAG: hypothetical protein ACT4NX_04955 [Deltaproteobacteria bacterium]